MSAKNKMLIGVVLFFFLLFCGFGWHLLVVKAASSAQARIIDQINENINGKLTVDHFGLSWYGALIAYQVVLYDNQNKSDRQ